MSFPPVYAEDAKLLILGSYPSPASYAAGFYYGHPRNRFWPVIAHVLGEKEPGSVEERRDMLLRHQVALWDVLAECEIQGAADISIRNPKPNDIASLINGSAIRAVFINGSMAYKLAKKFGMVQWGIPAVQLPSTSPANASFSLERLCQRWSVLGEYLGEKSDAN